MLYNYILGYKSISFKNFRIVSPAIFVNKSHTLFNSNYSLKHVLLDCVDVSDVRQNFYSVNNVCDLFTNIAGDTILKFLKEIDLYPKI
jgi:hypothetical protein